MACKPLIDTMSVDWLTRMRFTLFESSARKLPIYYMRMRAADQTVARLVSSIHNCHMPRAIHTNKIPHAIGSLVGAVELANSGPGLLRPCIAFDNKSFFADLLALLRDRQSQAYQSLLSVCAALPDDLDRLLIAAMYCAPITVSPLLLLFTDVPWNPLGYTEHVKGMSVYSTLVSRLSFFGSLAARLPIHGMHVDIHGRLLCEAVMESCLPLVHYMSSRCVYTDADLDMKCVYKNLRPDPTMVMWAYTLPDLVPTVLAALTNPEAANHRVGLGHVIYHYTYRDPKNTALMIEAVQSRERFTRDTLYAMITVGLAGLLPMSGSQLPFRRRLQMYSVRPSAKKFVAWLTAYPVIAICAFRETLAWYLSLLPGDNAHCKIPWVAAVPLDMVTIRSKLATCPGSAASINASVTLGSRPSHKKRSVLDATFLLLDLCVGEVSARGLSERLFYAELAHQTFPDLYPPADNVSPAISSLLSPHERGRMLCAIGKGDVLTASVMPCAANVQETCQAILTNAINGQEQKKISAQLLNLHGASLRVFSLLIDLLRLQLLANCRLYKLPRELCNVGAPPVSVVVCPIKLHILQSTVSSKVIGRRPVLDIDRALHTLRDTSLRGVDDTTIDGVARQHAQRNKPFNMRPRNKLAVVTDQGSGSLNVGGYSLVVVRDGTPQLGTPYGYIDLAHGAVCCHRAVRLTRGAPARKALQRELHSPDIAAFPPSAVNETHTDRLRQQHAKTRALQTARRIATIDEGIVESTTAAHEVDITDSILVMPRAHPLSALDRDGTIGPWTGIGWHGVRPRTTMISDKQIEKLDDILDICPLLRKTRCCVPGCNTISGHMAIILMLHIPTAQFVPGWFCPQHVWKWMIYAETPYTTGNIAKGTRRSIRTFCEFDTPSRPGDGIDGPFPGKHYLPVSTTAPNNYDAANDAALETDADADDEIIAGDLVEHEWQTLCEDDMRLGDDSADEDSVDDWSLLHEAQLGLGGILRPAGH